MDLEEALDPDSSLCPTQRDYYGLASYHGAAEFPTSEAVGVFFLIADNSSALITVA